VNDPIFENISPHELIWYAENIIKDEKEEQSLYRDMAEYNALFSNPEGVKQVRNSRLSESESSVEFDPEKEVKNAMENPMVKALKEKYKKQEEHKPSKKEKIDGILKIT